MQQDYKPSDYWHILKNERSDSNHFAEARISMNSGPVLREAFWSIETWHGKCTSKPIFSNTFFNMGLKKSIRRRTLILYFHNFPALLMGCLFCKDQALPTPVTNSVVLHWFVKSIESGGCWTRIGSHVSEVQPLPNINLIVIKKRRKHWFYQQTVSTQGNLPRWETNTCILHINIWPFLVAVIQHTLNG